MQLNSSIAKLDARTQTISLVDEDRFTKYLENNVYIHEPKQFNATDMYNETLTAFQIAHKNPRKRKSKPWFDRDCHTKHRELRLAFQNQPENIPRLKREYKILCRRKKSEYEIKKREKTIRTAESDKRMFWTMLNSGKRNMVPSNVQNSAWVSHFSELLYRVGLPKSREHDKVQLYDEYLDSEISSTEITEVCAAQKSSKAPGPDGISIRVIKQCYGVLLPLLYQLFYTCWTSQRIPESWKESYLLPLYKGKGDRSCPNNYRGLALGNVVYKIYTSILRKRLYNWANYKNLIPPNQYGFVPGKNSIQAANHLRREVKRIRESGRNPYLCFIDFTKAFDTVNRRTLLEKLKTKGLSTKFAKILGDILGKNYLRIIIGHNVSDKITQNCGVLQGDPLSPLLFILYIADLAFALDDLLTAIFYADDLVLIADNLPDLQRGLNRVKIFCDSHGLSVNDKTKAMKIRGGGGLSRNDTLRYDNMNIEFVNSFSYLGVQLSSTDSSSQHLKNLYKKGVTAVNVLNSKINLPDVNFESARRLLNAVILPSCTYGMSIFNVSGNESCHVLKVRAYFYKRWCRLSKFAHNTGLVLNIEGSDPLNIRTSFGLNRRLIGIYYSDGMHFRICSRREIYHKRCESCECKFCGQAINDDFHLLSDCFHFNGLPAIDILRTVHQAYSAA